MSDRLRILHVITSLAGGAGAYVYDLAKHTDPARFDVQLAFGPGYPLDNAVRRSGIQHHELSWKRSLDPIATLRGARDVSRLIRNCQPDILHVHCSLAGVVGRVLGRWHKVPNILFTVHVLAYNLGNFMRTPALPKEVEHWSLTTLREKQVKIGAKVGSYGRYVTFRLAEIAAPRNLFREILQWIEELRALPAVPT